MLTTGQIAAATNLSEKAVRLYADRGILSSQRDATNRRVFSDDQVDRARLVALLRTIGLPLTDVADVLDSDDPLGAYDRIWNARRHESSNAERASDYIRGALIGKPSLPAGLELGRSTVLSRTVLRAEGSAALVEMGTVLPALTARLFDVLTKASLPLAGPIYVEHRSRATETFAGEIRVCAPYEGNLSPSAGTDITVDEAHDELSIGLDQSYADDQRLVVTVHDYLTAEYGHVRRGPNREIYHPGFGSGAPGTVMHIAIPVAGGL